MINIGTVHLSAIKDFLEERGENYHQVLITDLRDVIFQADPFEAHADLSSFFGYVTEGFLIKNSTLNYEWIEIFFGKDEPQKIGHREIINAGTILGTVDAMKVFLKKITDTIGGSLNFGYDQAAINYLVYENKLDIENIIELNCQHGNVVTVGYFFKSNPINIVDNKILRGDGGIPAVIHQYDRYPILLELVDNLYRDKNFQPNEKFTGTRSMLEQTLHLAILGKIDDAYKLYTKYLFGRNFVGNSYNLINLWEATLQKNITSTSEMLMLSIQHALMSTGGNDFNFEHINKIIGLTNSCIKNHLVVSYPFKIFVGNILFNLANQLHAAKQFEQSLTCLDFINALEIPLDQKYYLLKAKIYREAGKKSEALAAYEKALNT